MTNVSYYGVVVNVSNIFIENNTMSHDVRGRPFRRLNVSIMFTMSCPRVHQLNAM